MPLVYAGVCSHGPGITARTERADPHVCEPFLAAFRTMGDEIKASGADALLVVAAEHFANFFMDNMPTFAMGMAPGYDGPVEDPEWLRIASRTVPGNPDLSQRLISEVMQTVDIAFAEEWRLDHGIIVPLNFILPNNDLPLVPCNINCQGPPLAPLHRVWAFGEALRRACDSVPERIAVVGTGGLSHWPATPDSGKINEAWDREFMDRWCANDRQSLLSYSDPEIYRQAGQGGFEIRTYIAVAAAAAGSGHIAFMEPIPVFATCGVVANMSVIQTPSATESIPH